MISTEKTANSMFKSKNPANFKNILTQQGDECDMHIWWVHKKKYGKVDFRKKKKTRYVQNGLDGRNDEYDTNMYGFAGSQHQA